MAAFSNASGKPSNLSVANSAMIVPMPKSGKAAVSMKTGAANPANANFVLEADFGDADFVSVGMLKSADGTALAACLGPSVAGVVPLNLGACEQIRARRTDANGGAAVVYINVAVEE